MSAVGSFRGSNFEDGVMKPFAPLLLLSLSALVSAAIPAANLRAEDHRHYYPNGSLYSPASSSAPSHNVLRDYHYKTWERHEPKLYIDNRLYQNYLESNYGDHYAGNPALTRHYPIFPNDPAFGAILYGPTPSATVFGFGR
jgi:hypothetical protein